MTETAIEFTGFEELVELLGPELVAEPARRFLMSVGVQGQRDIRWRAPKDTGRLGGSIGFRVDSDPVPDQVAIGTNVRYAPHMEYGTGSLTENAQATRDWTFPTGAELQRWAQRHGFDNGYVVAQIIRKRGGLAPRRYVREGFDALRNEIPRFLRQMARDIEEIWRKG